MEIQSNDETLKTPGYPYCRFGLIVTGKGERDFLPKFFSSLMNRAGCSFEVIGRIGQRNPITATQRILKMAGTGKTIPDNDAQYIGLPARHFLRNQPSHYVLLIDDVEAARRSLINHVFMRYRKAIDTMLRPEEIRKAGVHFFANMLEAYYFANSEAVNIALKTLVLSSDFAGDVETIYHPKNQLKNLFKGFDEREHGALIVQQLDLDYILANPNTCAFLRSLIGWCVDQLAQHGQIWDPQLGQQYQLSIGIREKLTKEQ